MNSEEKKINIQSKMSGIVVTVRFFLDPPRTIKTVLKKNGNSFVYKFFKRVFLVRNCRTSIRNQTVLVKNVFVPI